MKPAAPVSTVRFNSRRGRIAVALALVSMVVTGGVWVPHAFADRGADAADHPVSSGGMGTPEAAVEELLASVGASDPVGLLAVLHPEERYLVDTLYANATATAENAGAVDVDALLRSFYIEVSAGALVVEHLTDRLAWVTTDHADVIAQIDVAQLDGAVAADLSDAAPIDDYQGSFTPQADQLGVAVVNQGGQWFVSVLYTAAETARRELELLPQFATGAVGSAKVASPEQAVTALTDAVSSQDPRAVAAVLTPFEAGLVADYEATLGGELLGALEGYDLAVDPSHLTVVDQSADWAIVEVDRWSVGARREAVDAVEPTEPVVTDEYGDDYVDDADVVDWQLTVDGMCGEFRQWDGSEFGNWSEVDGTCMFTSDSVFNVASLFVDDGWRGPRFVVVNHDGGWSVSVIQTALNMVAPFTVDAVTAAAVAEFFFGFTDGFYETAVELVAAGAPVLPVGTSPVPTSGRGRVTVFRLGPGVAASVDLEPGGHRSCYLFVVDPRDAESSNAIPCDEPISPLPGEAIVIVTASSTTVFSGVEPLGQVTVTVT